MQAAFHVFGMELLCKLPLSATNQFFATFFKLPDFYWRGFLASRLTSGQLMAFAMLTLLLAPPSIKVRLALDCERLGFAVVGQEQGLC